MFYLTFSLLCRALFIRRFSSTKSHFFLFEFIKYRVDNGLASFLYIIIDSGMLDPVYVLFYFCRKKYVQAELRKRKAVQDLEDDDATMVDSFIIMLNKNVCIFKLYVLIGISVSQRRTDSLFFGFK